MDLSRFNRMDFLPALKALFNDLRVPVNYLADEPTSARNILKDTWKDNAAFNLMKDVYFLGMVDDAAFTGNKSMDTSKIKSDYDGVLIFGVTLSERENNRLPTRSQLAEIARAFNREYFYTPVNVVFQYNGYLAFANTERLKFKQEWREGEKAGKVSLLRDIDITNPHAGHLRILKDLIIPDSGKNKVDSFAKLYAYWQDVFSVSILNKKFYQELSNWYFWAVKEVSFPDSPVSLIHKLDEKEQAMKHEHNAKNVIRLLTRFLFVWFVKEKKLIPEELFDIDYLKNELLKDLSPVRDEGLFKEANIESVFYKAILQNLFFASLNCPIEPSGDGDNRKRGFRLKDNFGQHRDANYLMRYQDQFKNPEKFTELINGIVPFLNGGLFECLDNKTDKIYIDGFSDNLVKPHQLIVPDYLFFGFDREVDLSGVVGISTKAFKNATVKGLIPILESYKFTIAENTPIEEDVALDPELLGKVFENLLASYNPETKTTARKQTGSFYTPREIVNYMVDESLIAHLKNSVKNWGIEAEELDMQLHVLLSYDAVNPFAENNDLQKQIIHALDNCKILDPACGSGAFPMGILQKMVHILQKVDPENKYWQELQLNKAVKETEGVFAITDKKEREQKLIEINEAFDEKINDPDYARKLFLVENCIYGVDIQEIAAQISKLRFFISLVVDQKVDKAKPNFGIRALPNLETKFVAANTLIGIEKPEAQMTLFDNQEIKELEHELKNVRHRLFSAKSPATKRKLREKDKEIREKIGTLLVKHGWGNETAKQLAGWDPYDQNASSPFFDPEWMFDISDGFNVVIGNPPYLGHKEIGADAQKNFKEIFGFTDDMYNYFYHTGINFLCDGGIITYITPNTFLTLTSKRNLRNLFIRYTLKELFLVGYVFNEAYVDTVITQVLKLLNKDYTFSFKSATSDFDKPLIFNANINQYIESPDNIFYPPSLTNNIINNALSARLKTLHCKFRDLIHNHKKLKKNYKVIKQHRQALSESDLTVLGLVSEGAQGLVTGNNSKYLAVVCDASSEQEQILHELIQKIKNHKGNIDLNPQKHQQLYDIAEEIKDETNNPSFFGKFFLYKSVLKHEIKNFEELSLEEKQNGINGDNCWIYYSRGNDEGLKWKVPFVEAINWTQKNVEELKKGVLTNSRWQGSEFYNATGFGWVDYFTNQLKSFFVDKGPYSKNVVKFHSKVKLTDLFFTSLLNSKFITYYVKNFITNTHTLQINDGKVIPVIFPSEIFHATVNILSSVVLLNSNSWIEPILDSLFFELYFPDHMKDRKIDILQFVEKDLKEVMQGREFDQLTDDQKEKIINRLHARWTDPKSQIVKRMNSFAEKSPDILKPILESR